MKNIIKRIPVLTLVVLIVLILSFLADMDYIGVLVGIVFSLFSLKHMPFIYEELKNATGHNITDKGMQFESLIKAAGAKIILASFVYSILQQFLSSRVKNLLMHECLSDFIINIIANVIFMFISLIFTVVIFLFIMFIYKRKKGKWFTGFNK
ncbi:MAG: hypothetical protein FWE90_00960 [Defluviitaleaceae bacterium]|nr:hypothetical protein [Defluviitaleaceae bacterium]